MMLASKKLQHTNLQRRPFDCRRRSHVSSVAVSPFVISETSQLSLLANMTVLSIDTGDLAIIQRFASTGLITDASAYEQIYKLHLHIGKFV
jgi:hypothetical protein